MAKLFPQWPQWMKFNLKKMIENGSEFKGNNKMCDDALETSHYKAGIWNIWKLSEKEIII